MRKFILLAIFSFSFLNNNVFSSIQKTPPFENRDVKYVKQLHFVYKKIKKGHVPQKHLSYLKSLYLRSTLFPEHKDLVEKILTMRKKSNYFSQNMNDCLPQKEQDNKAYYQSVFQKAFFQYCQSYFKDRSIHQKGFLLQEHVYSLFESLLPYLLRHEPTLIITILSKRKELEFLKPLVAQSLITHNILASPMLLSLLKMDRKLTSHVQDIGIQAKKSNVFTKEILRLINVAKENDELKHFHYARKFYLNNKKDIRQTRVMKGFLSLAREKIANNFPRYANSVLTFLYGAAPSEHRNEILFQLIWNPLFNDDLMSARNVINKFDMLKKFSTLGSREKFWVSYILERSEKEDPALVSYYYKQIILSDPVSYYSVISRSILNKEANKSTPIKINRPSFSYYPISTYTEKLQRTMTKLSLFLKAEAYTFYRAMRDDTLNLRSHDVFSDVKVSKHFDQLEIKTHLSFLISKLSTEQSNFLEAFKILHRSLEDDVIDMNNLTAQYLFPLPYLEHIKRIDDEIDPLLVLSLIRQESAFNPDAVSRAGAKGLMQLMPSTARQFRRKIASQALTRPNVNLKIGIKYFKQLFKKYNGHLIYTLAAYNAGETRVRRWKKNLFKHKDPLLTIESIPFRETRKYVKLIYRNVYFYNILNRKEFSYDVLDPYTFAN